MKRCAFSAEKEAWEGTHVSFHETPLLPAWNCCLHQSSPGCHPTLVQTLKLLCFATDQPGISNLMNKDTLRWSPCVRHYISLYDQVIYRGENRGWQKREEGKIPVEGDGIELLMVPAPFSSEKNASLSTMLASVHAVFQLIFCLFKIQVSC